MKERPILFSAPMVRALLAGTKTQTRRVMKVQPPESGYTLARCISTTGPKKDEGRLHWIKWRDHVVVDGAQPYFDCPYGQKGDRLWVREAFQRDPLKDGEFLYRATQRVETVYDIWKPSIHMPKVASRITLEITNVRVERLNDISDDDAISEGVKAGHGQWEGCFFVGGLAMSGTTAKECFSRLWEKIHGPGSWEANPWVWVVEFKRVTAATSECTS